MHKELKKDVIYFKKTDHLFRSLILFMIIAVLMIISFFVTLYELGNVKTMVIAFMDTFGPSHEHAPLMIDMYNMRVAEVVLLGVLALGALSSAIMTQVTRVTKNHKLKKVKVVHLLAYVNGLLFIAYLVYALNSLMTISRTLAIINAEALDLSGNFTSFFLDLFLYFYLVYEASKALKDAKKPPLVIDGV